jgi:hypothetical protein
VGDKATSQGRADTSFIGIEAPHSAYPVQVYKEISGEKNQNFAVEAVQTVSRCGCCSDWRSGRSTTVARGRVSNRKLFEGGVKFKAAARAILREDGKVPSRDLEPPVHSWGSWSGTKQSVPWKKTLVRAPSR